MTILIYNGKGTCPISIRATENALRAIGITSIQQVGRDCFQNDDWFESTRCLIMPGGRDRPYMQALQGEKNASIRRYVQTGGRYFGICAGAYYACQSIEFEKGGPLEVIEERGLHFFSGKAIGPALGLGLFSYREWTGASITPLVLNNQEILPLFFNGGCTFSLPFSENVTLLAKYQATQQPAIILCQVGLGKALLSGVHPEFSENECLWNPVMQNQLKNLEKERLKYFSELFQILQEPYIGR